jgi:hypothetical protein
MFRGFSRLKSLETPVPAPRAPSDPMRLVLRVQGVVKTARAILATEGPRALYRGLGWSLAGIIPEAALCYGCGGGARG